MIMNELRFGSQSSVAEPEVEPQINTTAFLSECKVHIIRTLS